MTNTDSFANAYVNSIDNCKHAQFCFVQCFACLCILPMLILALVVGLVAAHMSDGLVSIENNV